MQLTKLAVVVRQIRPHAGREKQVTQENSSYFSFAAGEDLSRANSNPNENLWKTSQARVFWPNLNE